MTNSGTSYTVSQLGPPDAANRQRNIAVTSLESLVTHHPRSNSQASMSNGVIVGAEDTSKRSYAFIGGELQEVKTRATDEYRALSADQVLLIKDFILEDRSNSPWTRKVDVPAPYTGFVSRRDDRNGLVEISESPQGPIVARVRHLEPIAVNAGDSVRYGQNLGTQGNKGLRLPPGRSIHVHIEMDTRHYLQLEQYISDLTTGRLPIDREHRRDAAFPVFVKDGTFRVGESSPRIGVLQRVMANEGYRATGGGPLDQDGVYRLGMQGALLDFQHDHGVRQTGDIDPATLQFAPRARGRVPDLPDHFQPGLPMPRMAEPATAPGHPDHADHRPGLPAQPEPRINRRDEPSATLSPLLLPLAEALRRGDERSLSDACADIAGSDRLQDLLGEAREQACLADAPQLSAQRRREDAPLLVPA